MCYPIASTKQTLSTRYIFTNHIIQLDLNERRSRRDMSPQGRKRVAGMVARDYRTVSGIGQSYHNQVCTLAKLTHHSKIVPEHSVQTAQQLGKHMQIFELDRQRSI